MFALIFCGHSFLYDKHFYFTRYALTQIAYYCLFSPSQDSSYVVGTIGDRIYQIVIF